MKYKMKEVALWAMAIACSTAIVAMFWGGVAIIAMGVVHCLGGE